MKKVLTVDNEEIFLKTLCEELKPYEKEFQLITASRVKEAVQILESTLIDLLIIDLSMPEMDGFELISHVSRNFPDLPIIVITAFETTEIQNRVRDFVTSYIEKPINLQDFVDRIRSILKETASGIFRGITLFSFLQLIELEKKSCTIIV